MEAAICFINAKNTDAVPQSLTVRAWLIDLENFLHERIKGQDI
ncbi:MULTISPECIES: hypothetical protein [unclassified Iodidimonas]|jgi:hypothetical protein|nr:MULTISPECIES: hypothetical protein [unclassified Iodidimonas]